MRWWQDCGGGPGVMIGDSITDLNTARAARAPLHSLFLWLHPGAGRRAGRPDLVLDDFAALPGALAGLKLL